MKTFTSIFLVIILLSCNSTKNDSSKVNCPIVVGPRGAQLLLSFESAKKICNNRIMHVTVDSFTQKLTTAQDSYYNIYEMAQNDSMIMVSQASNKYYSPPDSGINFLMFKGIGNNAFWLGLEEHYGRFFTLTQDSILQIVGFQENKYRTTPDGYKILMAKGTGENDFFAGGSHEKLYKAIGDYEMEQIGIFDVFLLPATDNSNIRRTIVMTKSMNDNDCWCGELDGVIYIQE